jgi:hypothetical protein
MKCKAKMPNRRVRQVQARRISQPRIHHKTSSPQGYLTAGIALAPNLYSRIFASTTTLRGGYNSV